jgi:transketolase C-terminal domain/subunit
VGHIKASGGVALVVEEHYQCGGIFDAVCAALSKETGIKVHQIAVDSVPRSGPALALLEMYNLSGTKIAAKVKEILQ